MDGSSDPERQAALEQYKKKLLESREWEAKLKALRLEVKVSQKEYDKTEENLKALQSVGQIIGEVLKQLDEERCECFAPGTRLVWWKRSSCNDRTRSLNNLHLLTTCLKLL
jgi:ATP-dependent 26S proteasome regulatory subunit